MTTEIERRYFSFDRNELDAKIVDLNGRKIGTYHFRSLVFVSKPIITLIRLRDEGHRIRFTVKEKNIGDKYETESEVSVNDFDEMSSILQKMGHVKKHYTEKIREIYNIENSELVFDHYPGLPSYIEIESPTEEEMNYIAHKLSLDPCEKQYEPSDLYLKTYGIKKDRPMSDLSFDSVFDVMNEFITINREMMIDVVKEQTELLKKKCN